MDQLTSFARMFGDETRQQIMRIVCCNELSVNQVVETLAEKGNTVTQPTVSHHLNELRRAGLVNTRKEGRQVFYTLNQQGIAVCCELIMTTFAPMVSLDEIQG